MGELAALVGLATELDHRVVELARGLGREKGTSLCADYHSAWVRLGDALTRALSGKRLPAMAGKAAAIEQLRARLTEASLRLKHPTGVQQIERMRGPARRTPVRRILSRPESGGGDAQEAAADSPDQAVLQKEEVAR